MKANTNIPVPSYPPTYFINRQCPQALLNVIEQNPLATLIVGNSLGELSVSHIPFHFSEKFTEELTNRLAATGSEKKGDISQVFNKEKMHAHVSNKHPLAIELTREAIPTSNTLTQGEQDKKYIEIELIFHGEDSYISPNDVDPQYSAMQKVPTWNYSKVHVKGFLTLVNYSDEKHHQMNETTQYFEQMITRQVTDIIDENVQGNGADVKLKQSWSLNQAPTLAIEQMLKAITVFTVTITDIEGRFKLSQNKPKHIREQLAQQVAQRNKKQLAKQLINI